MVQFIDGADWSGTASNWSDRGNRAKYTAGGSGPGSFTPVAGFGVGSAYELGGSGPFDIALDLATQPKWYATMYLQPQAFFGGSGYGDAVFARLDSAVHGSPVLSVVIDASGFIRFYTGGDFSGGRGSLIGIASGYQFPFARWSQLDIVCDVPGRLVELWVSDVRIAQFTGVVWDAGTSVFPDRWSWTWFPGILNKSVHLDHFALADSQGAANNGRLGPCQVLTKFPNADRTAQWVRSIHDSNGALANANFKCVNDDNAFRAFPDGDSSYVDALASAVVDMYGFDAYTGTGCNLAVALNAVLRTSDGFLPCTMDLLVRNPLDGVLHALPGGTVGAIAATYFPTSGYTCRQRISETSIVSGDQWGDSEITSLDWGMRQSIAAPRVTQMFLEKLKSTRPSSKPCGSVGSYAYAHVS